MSTPQRRRAEKRIGEGYPQTNMIDLEALFRDLLAAAASAPGHCMALIRFPGESSDTIQTAVSIASVAGFLSWPAPSLDGICILRIGEAECSDPIRSLREAGYQVEEDTRSNGELHLEIAALRRALQARRVGCSCETKPLSREEIEDVIQSIIRELKTRP